MGGSGAFGGSGGSKSLKEFEGADVFSSVPYVSGSSVSIETVYGDVTVEQSVTPGQIEVVFHPFNFQEYDQEALAVQQMNENLQLSVTSGSDFSIQALRQGDVSSGLGASITMRLPAGFDGALTINNHGDGPVEHFDSNVVYVGAATAVTINGASAIGACAVTGAPSVTSTNVDCGDQVSVLGVADDVNITVRNGLGLEDPSIVLRLASISESATGGTIQAADGSIDFTLPSSGDFSVQATAASGSVETGTPPASCNLQENGPTAKTVTCGSGGPIYVVTTDGENGVFQAGTIGLEYQ